MCAKVVGGISLLLFVMALILVIFAAGARNQEAFPSFNGMSNDNKNQAAAFAGPLFFVAIILIIISILGCVTAKFKHPLAAIPFSMAVGVLALITLIVGALAITGGTIGRKLMDEGLNLACNQMKNDKDS
jgi:hypothetical protein